MKQGFDAVSPVQDLCLRTQSGLLPFHGVLFHCLAKYAAKPRRAANSVHPA